MEKDVTILDLLDKLEKEELDDFLPPDENVRKGFMAFIKFLMLSA
jgi:hypothetical protein